MDSGESKLPKVRVKGIVLPTEHGSWGFLAEPIVGSLAVAWSGAGAWTALLVVGAFLSRQPLKIFLGDVFAGRTLPQTSVARRFALLFIFISSIGFAGAVYNGGLHALWPFAVVAPLALVQIYFDARRQSRAFAAELIGAVAMSSSAAAISLAGGKELSLALALWTMFGARLVTSILYVRNRLRAGKGKEFSFWIPKVSHSVAFFAVAALAYLHLLPWTVTLAFAMLAVRSAAGLSRFRKSVKAMRIGVFEVIYGAILVLTLIVGTFWSL